MIYAQITDGKGTKNKAQLHQANGRVGLIAFTDDLRTFQSRTTPFVNPTYGNDLAQNGAATGTPEKIHNGGTSTEWNATAVAGTWNFADAGKTTITSGNNLDEALFEKPTGTIDMSNYVSITGKVNLTAYDDTRNNFVLNLGLAGVQVGNTVNLNDYIDSALIGTEQSFSIPKADLGITTDTIDEFRIVVSRTGGTRPDAAFDDLQIEETGGGLEFTVTPNKGKRFSVTEIILAIADTGTGGTAFAYDQIGAISTLTTGINIRILEGGEVGFSITFRQNAGLIAQGAVIGDKIDDGTDTFYTLKIDLRQAEPRVLNARLSDKIIITINDDVSGLLYFRAFARGKEEDLN